MASIRERLQLSFNVFRALAQGQVAPLPNRHRSGTYPNWVQMLQSWMAQYQPVRPDEARYGIDNSIVSICLHWIATSWQVAVPQVGIEGADGFEPLENGHWLVDLLHTPADDMDGQTVLWAWLTDFIRYGNAYGQVIKTRGGSQIVRLPYLPAKWVKPIPDNRGRLHHYEYTCDGQTISFLPDEILHIRHGVDEDNVLQGVSPLAAQYREIVADNRASDWAANLLKTGIPPLLFTPRAAGDGTVNMTGEQARDLSKALNEKLQQEPGSARIIPGSLEMHQTGVRPNEMALTDVRAMPETRIPAALGLPALLLQLYTGVQKSTFANFEQAVKQGWLGCIIPYQRIFAGAITRQVLHQDPRAKSQKLAFRWDTSQVPELQADMVAIREAARADKLAGIITIDEARAEQGLAPDTSLNQPDPQTTDPATQDGQSGQGSGAQGKGMGYQMGSYLRFGKVATSTGDIYAVADQFRRRLARNEADALDYLAAEWSRATAATRKRLADIVARLAEAEAGGVPVEERLTLLAERLADLLPQMQDRLDILAERGAAIIEQAQHEAIRTAREGAESMAKAQGIGTWNRLNADAFESLAGLASDGSPLYDVLQEAFGDYADAIRTQLLAGVAQGMGPKQVAAKISALTGTARARTEAIARTEMLRASREACRKTYQENRDVLDGWIRLSAADVRTCPACWALHGTLSAVDDIMPTHVSCRCAMVPYPRDPELRSEVPSGEELFRALPPDDQEAILGPGLYEQWQGGLPFSEFADISSDPRWGPTVDTRRVSDPYAQELPA